MEFGTAQPQIVIVIVDVDVDVLLLVYVVVVVVIAFNVIFVTLFVVADHITCK